MLLKGKTAVIFGGSGAIGGAVARVFTREGASVFLGARGAERLERTLASLNSEKASAFRVDTLDAKGTADAVDAIARETGGIDVVLNSTSFLHDQGSFIDDLDTRSFMHPVETLLTSLFNTTKAVVPHMGGGRAGVILTLTTPVGRSATPGHLGFSVACAGIEAFTRALAAELGPRNIRAVCLAPHAIADAPKAGSYTAQLFAPKAEAMGMSVDEWLAGAAGTTMLGRLPTLDQVAETAAFVASDRAGAMTASYINLTGGMVVE